MNKDDNDIANAIYDNSSLLEILRINCHWKENWTTKLHFGIFLHKILLVFRFKIGFLFALLYLSQKTHGAAWGSLSITSMVSSRLL